MKNLIPKEEHSFNDYLEKERAFTESSKEYLSLMTL